MKKGQAAIEFIMTYGWAILVVMVAIAALAYFGVLSPSKFLPERCILPPGMACTQHKATTTGLTLVVTNSLGNSINITDITDVTGVCSSTGGFLANGATATYTFSGCTHPVSGEQYKSDLTISYVIQGLNHTKTGTLTTQVE